MHTVHLCDITLTHSLMHTVRRTSTKSSIQGDPRYFRWRDWQSFWFRLYGENESTQHTAEAKREARVSNIPATANNVAKQQRYSYPLLLHLTRESQCERGTTADLCDFAPSEMWHTEWLGAVVLVGGTELSETTVTPREENVVLCEHTGVIGATGNLIDSELAPQLDFSTHVRE
jgi:hypothetical protein